jgi:regulatory protein
MALSGSGEAEKARDYALLLLSYRERTEKEMAERLQRKNYPAETAAAVIADFKRLGLLDDERFARLYVQERARLNPRSARLIGMELGKKGVSREIAEKALRAEFVAGREEEMAAAVVRRAASRLRGVESETAKRRLWAYLARRGFTPGQIAAAVKAAAEEK